MDGRPVQKLLSYMEVEPISVNEWTLEEVNKVAASLSAIAACKVADILRVLMQYSPGNIKCIEEVPQIMFVASVTSNNKAAFDLLIASHLKEFRSMGPLLLDLSVMLNRTDMLRDIVDKCRLVWSDDTRQLLYLAKSLDHEACAELLDSLSDANEDGDDRPMEESMIRTETSGMRNASWTVFEHRHDVAYAKQASGTKHSSWTVLEPKPDLIGFTEFAGDKNVTHINPFIMIMNNDKWLSGALYADGDASDEPVVVTLMKRLCANGIDPNCVELQDFSQPWHSSSVLHWVIDSCYCSDLLRTLLEAGADFNCDDAYGYPPLSKAAYILNDFDKFCEILKYNPLVTMKVLSIAATSDIYMATANVRGSQHSSFLLMLLDCGYRGGPNYTLIAEIEKAFESFHDSQLAIKDSVMNHSNGPKRLKIICRRALQRNFPGLAYTKFVNNLVHFPARLKDFLLLHEEISCPRNIGEWLEIEKMSPFTLFA